jgi:flagellar basal-body rod protein FlgC
MAENIFSTFDISGQGMSIQRMRLSAVSRNIANVNTTKSTDGRPYQREVVVVRANIISPFEKELDGQIQMLSTDGNQTSNLYQDTYPPDNQILSARTVRDANPSRLVYDPHHPDANPEGYVEMPNINIVTEMVEMITAQRAFEANTGVVESAKNFARYSLEI